MPYTWPTHAMHMPCTCTRSADHAPTAYYILLRTYYFLRTYQACDKEVKREAFEKVRE